MSEQLLRALALALVCAVYLCVAVVTSRGFIVAPLRQVLLRQAESQALAITALEEQAGVPAGSSVAARATAAVLEQLRVSRSRLRRLWAWPFDTPLTKLYAEMVRLAAARRAMIDLVPDATVSAHVTVVLDRLATVDPDRVPALRTPLVPTTVDATPRFGSGTRSPASWNAAATTARPVRRRFAPGRFAPHEASTAPDGAWRAPAPEN